MNLTEMHVMFRQYAQQMGMQNTRAILPEQIDLLLNTSIYDTVNQIIKENIGVTNDRVITDNSKIGQINALSSLYSVKKFDVNGSKVTNDTSDDTAGTYNIYTINLSDVVIANAATAPTKVIAREGSGTNGDDDADNSGDASNDDNTNRTSIDYLYLVDLAINYTYTPVGESNSKKTNLFPIRIIDDAYLADTLNDFILKPTFRSPVAVVINNTLQVYLDPNVGGSTVSPKDIRCSFIAKPVKVQYLSDVGGANVDCNLPEYLHIDVVKHAVDLYRIAVTGSLHSAQQQETAQQQENLRNNYRNDNPNAVPQRQ